MDRLKHQTRVKRAQLGVVLQGYNSLDRLSFLQVRRDREKSGHDPAMFELRRFTCWWVVRHVNHLSRPTYTVFIIPPTSKRRESRVWGWCGGEVMLLARYV
jgi:hypothetical protein